jgi:hypothetical protein
LRKMLKLSTFSNLKWGKPSNWGNINGSSTVYCMFGNSNSEHHLIFVGAFQPLLGHDADHCQNMGSLLPLGWYIFMRCLEAGTPFITYKKESKALFLTGHGGPYGCEM